MKPLTLRQKLKSFAVVSSCSVGFFTAFNIYKGNQKFYDNFLMPIVQQLPPEACHRAAVLACKYNLFQAQSFADPPTLGITFLGRHLSNPIGIAAGFDKQGEAIHGLHRIGFGFVEIGSVTPLPQLGNPKPRVFRLIEDRAIVNRYGFNSDGHEKVFKRISSTISRTSSQDKSIMLGINLGKNKLSENAGDDYVRGIKLFSPIADYLVINVSSPNTPGLRDLQGKDDLKRLLHTALATRHTLPKSDHQPILLKLAPDLTKDQLREIAEVIDESKYPIDGLIISNTTIDRDNSLKSSNKIETGGLSGVPLRDRSTEMIAEMYKLTKGRIPIIGVGGIFNGQDAYDKIQAGASVVQIYTSFIYHGPPVVNTIKTQLDELLRKDGYNNISEAIGSKAKLLKK